jgi:hypothetical protein
LCVSITNGARCTREIKAKVAMPKAAFNNKKILSTIKFYLNLRKKLVKCFMWNAALYDAQIWTHQKSLESSEMWCWRRIKKVSWTDCGRNEKVLQGVEKERNILLTIRRKKAN